MVSPDSYTLQGRFARFQPGWCATFDGPAPDAALFSSCATPNSGEGSFRTAAFRAPDTLRLWMAGFPEEPGIRIYLEDQNRRRTLDLHGIRSPGLRWRERIWQLPAEWRGANVRFIAEDHSHNPVTGWIALSFPQAGDDSYAFRLARALLRTAFLVPLGLLALLPGVALALYLARRCALEPWRAIAWILVGGGLGAYATFWPYLDRPALGRAVSFAVPVASLTVIGWTLRRGLAFITPRVLREVSLCFAAVTLVAGVSAASGMLFFTDDDPGEIAQVRYLDQMIPPDNILPSFVARQLYNGDSVLNMQAFYAAHSSDRPPLQSSFMLMEYPFWVVLSKSLSGYLLSIWLQCTWVAGMWVLLRAAGVKYRCLIPAIAFAALSGFCMLHSFFVWPKLLSATYCFICLACVPAARVGWVRGRGTPWSFADGVLAVTAACLSMLCHPDCLFTFVALSGLLLAARALPRPSILLAGASVAICLFLPWKLYQTYYDPTDGMLSKLHLAGSHDPRLTLTQAIVKAYGSLTPAQWIEAKREDLVAIAGRPLEIFRASNTEERLERWRSHSAYSLLLAVGVMWLGLAARFFAGRGTVRSFADRLLAIAGLSFVIWVLIMFEAGATMLHQGSFGAVLLLFTALAIYLAEAGAWWMWTALAVQLSLFAIFILARPATMRVQDHAILDGSMDPGMLSVVVLGVITLLGAAYFMRGSAAMVETATPAPR